jgi:hypothetical protein
MARKRHPLTSDEFFASLNNQSDLRAITHGHQALVDVVDEGVEAVLAERHLPSEPLQRLGIEGQVDLLILAGRLDVELRELFSHLTRVRHRLVPGYGSEFTDAEGRRAWALFPKPAKDAAPPLLDASDAGQVIRWAIVVLHARVMNRSVRGHDPDIPYS